MQNKSRILKVIFVFFILSLIIPVYYLVSIATEGFVLQKFIKEIINEKSSIEYFNFTNLEGVLDENFNKKQYQIYIYANSTKGNGEIARESKTKISVKNTEIYNCRGTAQSKETKDIYNFQSKLMNISQQQNRVRLYRDFTIQYKQYKQSGVFEMHGDNITFNINNNSAYSDAPVIMQGEDSILIGGTFLFVNNVITMKGDIFVDSPKIIITSDLLKVELNKDSSFLNKSSVLFKTASFIGNVKMLDKTDNTKISANKVTINYKKNIAILEGNAIITRNGNVAKGSRLTYNLKSGIASLKSDPNERVKLFINY